MKTSRKLRFPPPREWQDIVQDFELMPTQAETLKVTLEEALDAINQYQAKLQNQPNRSDLVKGLKNFEKALRRLRDECRRSADLIEHFLPDGTLAFIGQSLTFAAISEALGKDVSPERFDFYFKIRIKRRAGRALHRFFRGTGHSSETGDPWSPAWSCAPDALYRTDPPAVGKMD